MTPFSIGQVARRAGVGVETIRFYERRGLLPEPARRSSGYRAYGPGAVERLLFIRRAKDLGFSLQEISEILAIEVSAEGSCADVRRRVLDKIEDVDRRIESLQGIRSALGHLASACSGIGSTDRCAFLEALKMPEPTGTGAGLRPDPEVLP